MQHPQALTVKSSFGYTVVCFLKSREHEFTQNLTPVGLGPSSKTCPRWARHSAHFTSMRWRPAEEEREKGHTNGEN